MKDLRDIPAIRAEAERRAKSVWRHERENAGADKWLYPDEWGDGPTHPARILGHLDLLCDLSDPGSRDAVARMVAERVGLVCGATAPDFARFVCGEHCCDGDRGLMVPCSRPIWSMMGADETQMVTFADCPDPDEWDGDERRHIPGISAVTDPADALRLIALSVLA